MPTKSPLMRYHALPTYIPPVCPQKRFPARRIVLIAALPWLAAAATPAAPALPEQIAPKRGG